MNKCYRLVFDEARRMLVPVAELKAARGKGRGRSCGGARLSAVALLMVSFGSECWPGTALAGGTPAAVSPAQSLLPQSGRVVAGSAQIATPTIDQMVIEQSSQRAVIDWQSFNIGAGDTVRFAQPSSTAQALNRVVGLTGTTQILGKLTANGQVFIVNPQGVVFGKGAVVDTAALLATTHDIAPSAFMAHGASLLLAGGSNGTGLVDNEGTLSTAPGGWVALVGDQVKNGGGIAAPGGTVALAAGAEATLALANGQLVSLKLDRAAANARVIDSGTILANSAAGTRVGQVLISADTAQSLLDQAINITGVVQAGGGTANRGGQITVDGGANGTVSLQNATLTVASAAGAGGQVSVTGKQVTLYDAHLNASGATGGGTILAGGTGAGVSAYGSTLAVRSAEGQGGTAVLTGSTVSVLEGSHIDASGRSGGGTVIVGGDKLGKVADLMCVTLASRTVVDGSSAIDISSSGGNGGFLETSGRSVDIAGTVIAESHGTSGQWLIDPDNLVVTNGTTSTATNTSGTWTPVAGAGGSYVLDSALTGANVTLDASGDIYSDSNVVVNDAGHNVTLIAGNVGIEGSWTAANLIFKQSGTGGILGTVTGNVIAQTGTLNDYSSGAITGTVTVDSGAIFSIYTNSGLARTLGNDLILNGGTVQTGGVDGIATGGTLARSNGVEVINIFDASGTLDTSAWSGSKTATYLLVGGGGGGGMNWGGGGGAGGVQQGSASASNGSLPVGVGAGGAGATGSADGANGGNTTFDGLTAEGGGGGAQASANSSLIVGANGGSGGGGGTDGRLLQGSGGTGVTGQGNSGGTGIPSPRGYPVPGGGGGAGAAGANASSTAGGAGGIGIKESLTGVDTYYGGGGGGGGYYCATVSQNYGFGSGGTGGGGSGAKNARSAGLPGAANTGGGGGGGAGSSGAGGAGGSGIAVVASNIAGTSDTALTANTTVTLTGTVTLSAGASSTFGQNMSGAQVVARGILSGSGGLAQAGTGTLTLTADNTYTGATNVSAGTLQIGNGGANGTLGTGALVDDAALVVNYGVAVSLSAIAPCTSGITGSGNFTAVSAGALTIDRAVNLSGGNGSVLLAAGCATAAGNAGGGDVTLTSPVSVGAGGTVTIFSGNPNTTTLEGQLSGASGATRYKTYDAGYADADGAVSGTHNFYYRGADSVSLSATATLASKTYDATADAAGDINISAVSVFESVTDGNNISFSSLAAGSAAFGSPHALGVDGSTVELSFGNTAQFSANGANWSVAGLSVGNLSGNGTITPAVLALTATSQTKSYDGTGSAASLETVSGLVATDTLGNAALAEAYGSPHALGTDGSTLNVATALTNASFARGSVGYITDYTVSYVTAKGTITPAALEVAPGSNLTLYDVPTTTLADMSGNVQPGQGYVSDYSPNVINNGNLTFAGPDDATLASLTGTGNLTVDANQVLTVTGTFTEKSVTVDGGAVLTYPGSGVAGQMQPVESGISAVEWIRNGTMNDTEVMPGASGISVVDGKLCTRPKEGSKVCQ